MQWDSYVLTFIAESENYEDNIYIFIIRANQIESNLFDV